MPEPSSPDVPKDEGTALAHEQAEALRKSIDKFSRSVMPKIELPQLGIPELAINTFGLPESTIKSISGMAGYRLKMMASFRPLFRAQDVWAKQFAVLNSDALRIAGLGQSNLNLFAGALGKNVDFGISDSMAKLAQQFAAQQTAWLKTLEPLLASANWTFYPPNLDEIEGLSIEQVEAVALADGIPLYGVPRTSIAEALVTAESTAKRREILGRRSKAITEDCRTILGGCNHEAVARHTPFAMAALDALEAGHAEAAQALTCSVVDSLITVYLGKDKHRYRPDKKGRRTSDELKDFTLRQFLAFAPMWQAYQQFWVDEGDTVPTTFSRNATAHTVSRRQFTKRNAVQGTMFAVSLIYFLDGEAKRIGRMKARTSKV